MRALAPACLALALGACAHVAAPRPVDLTRECVSDIRALPVIPVSPLPADREKKVRPVDYATVAHCVRSPDGSTFAVAVYRLDGIMAPLVLRVTTRETAGGVLAAAVTTLDADYHVLQRHGFEQFLNRGDAHMADIVVNDVAASYVLLSPDAAQVGHAEKQFGSVNDAYAVPVGLGAFVMVNNGHATQRERAYSDAGMVSVTVQPAGAIAVPVRH